jgi:hypothetical protein
VGQDDARAVDAQLRPVVEELREAYGMEKLAVSDNFIEASREKLQELLSARWASCGWCGADRWHALPRPADGRKTVLGLREGGRERQRDQRVVQ